MAEAIPSEVEVDNPQKGILDFTPEQWSWIKSQAAYLEANYVPTKSLLPRL